MMSRTLAAPKPMSAKTSRAAATIAARLAAFVASRLPPMRRAIDPHAATVPARARQRRARRDRQREAGGAGALRAALALAASSNR